MSKSRVDPIILSSAQNTSMDSSKLSIKFSQPQHFSRRRLALAYAGLYYSWRNVSGLTTKSGKDGFNNNWFSYIWTDGVEHQVDLGEGFYTISDLNAYLHLKVMKPKGHYVLDADQQEVYFIHLEANSTYYSCTASMYPVTVPTGGSNPNSLVLGSVPQLKIPQSNNFGLLLGYDPQSYPPTAGTTSAYFVNSQNVPNISPVTTVNIECNLTESNANISSSVIYQFSPTVGYNQYVTVQPPYLIYYDVTDGNYDGITLTFRDQDNNPIDIIDRNITVTLLLESN